VDYSALRIALYTASQWAETSSKARAVVSAALSKRGITASTSVTRVSRDSILCPRCASCCASTSGSVLFSAILGSGCSREISNRTLASASGVRAERPQTHPLQKHACCVSGNLSAPKQRYACCSWQLARRDKVGVGLSGLCGPLSTTPDLKLVTIDTRCYGQKVAFGAKARTGRQSHRRSSLSPPARRSRLGRSLSRHESRATPWTRPCRPD
jgi:hypothetical protein